MNRLTRLAVVPAATLLFGSLFSLAAPAANAAPCYYGDNGSFAVATAGVMSDSWDSWNTTTAGPATLTLTASDLGMRMAVWDQSCDRICGFTTSCAIGRAGDLYVEVLNGSGEYVLTAIPTGAGVPDIGTPAPTDCNIVNTAGVCVALEAGDVIQRVTVREPVVGTTNGPGVVGRIEQWRLPLPTGGSVVIPCVVLGFDNLGTNGCTLIGATYVGTTAVLVDDDVPIPSVGFGNVLASVGLCEATLTATVVGFGLEDFPAVSLC